MTSESDMTAEPGAQPTITFAIHYVKATSYKEAACHGVIGGPTPSRKVYCAFYSERGPVPRAVEYAVAVPPGSAGFQFNEGEATPSFVDTRQGVVRNLEAGIYLDVEMAEKLATWLTAQVNAIREEGEINVG